MSFLLKIELVPESAVSTSSSVQIQAGREGRLQKAERLAGGKKTDL